MLLKTWRGLKYRLDFVRAKMFALRCNMVSLKLREVDCKPQQVAFVYLNLLKNRVVLNPRWNFVDTLYIHMTVYL